LLHTPRRPILPAFHNLKNGVNFGRIRCEYLLRAQAWK
jgi:hypothetical protein